MVPLRAHDLTTTNLSELKFAVIRAIFRGTLYPVAILEVNIQLVHFNPYSFVLVDPSLSTRQRSLNRAALKDVDGDIAVVERGLAARKGDFVVAMVDNEFTLKELGYEQGKPVLRPHNRAYPTIRPTTDLEIVGVVVAQFRSYTKNKHRYG